MPSAASRSVRSEPCRAWRARYSIARHVSRQRSPRGLVVLQYLAQAGEHLVPGAVVAGHGQGAHAVVADDGVGGRAAVR